VTAPAGLTEALVDRYRIERELGQGGMATVYLAEDLKHKRKVALKVLRPELAAVIGAERFVQEIKTTANLQHPHILPLFDSGTAGSFLYYVMPYIEGETLRGKLDRETQLGIDDAVRIAREVADALDYAHQHGVIHRDIKPENILLQNGRPMVADFGIALAVSAAAGGRMTETGLSLGTPHYMSPEQATAEKEISARSDVYSLASVLYEMLTGNPPHTGASAQQIIMKIVTEEAAPVTKLRKAVPPNVAAAVAKALEKLPADRFESARAFGEALGNPSFTTVGMAGAAAAGAAAGSRWPWLVAGVATVAAVMLAAQLAGTRTTAAGGTPWIVDLGVRGFGSGLAISPDGSFILYGGNRIWMRRADAQDPIPIPGTEGGCCPALSPDGQRVAFVRGREIRIVPLAGGASTLAGSGVDGGDNLAWLADGSIIGTTVGGSPLFRFPASGGDATPYTVLDSAAGEAQHWSPHALPNEKGLLFTTVGQSPAGGATLQIAVVGSGGGAHTVLMPGRTAVYAEPGYLLVTRTDGGIVAVPFDLAARRITGDAVPLLTVPNEPGTFSWRGYAVVAPTGAMVYVGGTEPRFDFVWADGAGRTVPVDSNEPAGATRSPAISPDGTTLAYEYFLGNTRVIEVRNLRTGASSRISDSAGPLVEPMFSADSRFIYFRLTLSARGGLYRAPLGRLAEVTPVLPAPERSLVGISPDGQTLYLSQAGTRGVDILARSADGADATESRLAVATAAGWLARVSPDGRWLAYVGAEQDASQLFLRSTDPMRTERWPVFGFAPGAGVESGGLGWAPNSQELYFLSAGTMRVARLSRGTDPAPVRVDSLFRAQQVLNDLAVAPDGRLLLNQVRSGVGGQQLVLIHDWRALLGRP